LQHEFARPVDEVARPAVAYSIGTLVTKPEEYAEMTASFRKAGFGLDDCEYIYVDNSDANQSGACLGLNKLLNAASGRHVVLCHQDVRPIESRATLDARLQELEHLDPAWAVAGNAGGAAPGQLAIRITDPHGANSRIGTFPARVHSLDENFLVIKHAARIGFSRDLDGFHFYGADICLSADVAGYASYVIDYHLEHLSPGRKDESFDRIQQAFQKKWARALRPRWLQTTCALVRLSGDQLDLAIGRLAERPFSRIARRLPGAVGWRRSG
jgi:hypothetical protein